MPGTSKGVTIAVVGGLALEILGGVVERGSASSVESFLTSNVLPLETFMLAILSGLSVK